jgi:hypothetical protein
MPDDKPADHFQTIADLRRELARAQAERDEAIRLVHPGVESPWATS